VRVTGIHHVAFAHEGGAATLPALTRLLGLEVAHVEEGDGFTERMLPAGECYLQLLEAGGPGVVRRFLDRRGPGLHHIAFTVPDLDGALAELRAEGVRLVDEAARPGGMGTRIAFIHPSAFGGLLVELVEEEPRAGGPGNGI